MPSSTIQGLEANDASDRFAQKERESRTCPYPHMPLPPSDNANRKRPPPPADTPQARNPTSNQTQPHPRRRLPRQRTCPPG